MHYSIRSYSLNVKERDTFSTALRVDKEEQQLSHTATRKMTIFPRPYHSFHVLVLQLLGTYILFH